MPDRCPLPLTRGGIDTLCGVYRHPDDITGCVDIRRALCGDKRP